MARAASSCNTFAIATFSNPMVFATLSRFKREYIEKEMVVEKTEIFLTMKGICMYVCIFVY